MIDLTIIIAHNDIDVIENHYSCTVNQRKRYTAFFLACVIYAAALGFVPNLEISSDSSSSALIKKDISCQMTCVIKNDLSVSAGGLAIKVKKSFEHLGAIEFSNKFLLNKSISAQLFNSFIITGCIKEGVKSMIYPFHTYW